MLRLEFELRRKHLTYSGFCREYDKAARRVDSYLVGTAPGRAQFYRWLRGEMKGLPYPDRCRVLEAMFPGTTAAELFTLHRDGTLGLLNRVGPDRPVFDVLDTQPRHNSDDVVKVGAANEHSGEVVNLSVHLDIRISTDGAARLSYRYMLLNLTDRPLTRITRELWFENTSGALHIRALRGGSRQAEVQRIHDTPNLAKFACQVSPPIQPGESAVIGYTCDGAYFLNSRYWRQAFNRHTRQFSIHLHQADSPMRTCSAVEEHPDGTENSITDYLVWDDGAVMLGREDLRPNQAVTLRWEVACDDES